MYLVRRQTTYITGKWYVIVRPTHAKMHVFSPLPSLPSHRQLNIMVNKNFFFFQILFPVLQKLVEADEHSGHYFLIVLNLRNNRFEVLDSMRTLEDKKLANCCNKIVNCIKTLWRTYYDGTIEKYELVNIAVSQQRNK